MTQKQIAHLFSERGFGSSKLLPWEFLETNTGMGSNSSSLAVSAPGSSKPEIKQESAAKR